MLFFSAITLLGLALGNASNQEVDNNDNSNNSPNVYRIKPLPDLVLGLTYNHTNPKFVVSTSPTSPASPTSSASIFYPESQYTPEPISMNSSTGVYDVFHNEDRGERRLSFINFEKTKGGDSSSLTTITRPVPLYQSAPSTQFLQSAPLYQSAPIYQQPLYQEQYQPPYQQQPLYQQQPTYQQQPIYNQPVYNQPVYHEPLPLQGFALPQPLPASYPIQPAASYPVQPVYPVAQQQINIQDQPMAMLPVDIIPHKEPRNRNGLFKNISLTIAPLSKMIGGMIPYLQEKHRMHLENKIVSQELKGASSSKPDINIDKTITVIKESNQPLTRTVETSGGCDTCF